MAECSASAKSSKEQAVSRAIPLPVDRGALFTSHTYSTPIAHLTPITVLRCCFLFCSLSAPHLRSMFCQGVVAFVSLA